MAALSQDAKHVLLAVGQQLKYGKLFLTQGIRQTAMANAYHQTKIETIGGWLHSNVATVVTNIGHSNSRKVRLQPTVSERRYTQNNRCIQDSAVTFPR